MKKPDKTIDMAMGIAAVQESSGLFREGKYKDCVILLEKAIQSLDGIWLGRALLLLGDSLNRSPDFETIINPSKAKGHLQKSLKYLNQAYDLLSAEGEDNATLTYCKELSDSISKELKAME